MADFCGEGFGGGMDAGFGDFCGGMDGGCGDFGGEIPIPDLSAMVEQLEQWITMHKQGLKERKRHLKDMSARQKEVYDRDLKMMERKEKELEQRSQQLKMARMHPGRAAVANQVVNHQKRHVQNAKMMRNRIRHAEMMREQQMRNMQAMQGYMLNAQQHAMSNGFW